ncbi:MAG: hypothetical protein Fues2KO_47190 [Fuerstiella sp.]
MASKSGIEAGRAFVKVFLEDSEYNAKLKGVQAKLRATGAMMNNIGRDMLSMGSKMLLPFIAAMAIFIPFSDRMKEVQAVTGATAAEFDTLNESAKRLGATTSFTASQVAGAMAELGRAGFDPTQIDQATEHVLNLARASGTELPRAAEIMASTLSQFGLQASDSQRVADVLTASVNSSALGMEDLAEALKPVAPIAAEAGASLEDTAAAIGILGNNGIRGSLAGNALARAYKNLSTPATRQELERLGVAVVDTSGNLRSLSEILADLGTATQNFGNAERLALFETVFGRGQAAALKLAGAVRSSADQMKQLASPAARKELDALGVSLTKTSGEAKSLGEVFDEVRAKTADLGRKEQQIVFETIGFDDLLTKLKLSEDAAADTAEMMDAGIGGSMRKMLSAIEGVAIALSEAIEGPATEWMDWIGELSGSVSKFIQQNRALVTLIAKVGAGLVIAAGAFIATAAAIRVVTFAVGAYRTITKAAAATQAFLIGLSGPKGWAMVAAGVAVATGAVYAFNEAMQEDEAAAKKAMAANEDLTGELNEAKSALDGLNAADPPDLRPMGTPELLEARTAAERLAVTMAGLRGETERALRLAAAGDSLKALELLGGDVSANPADRVREMLQQALPAGEQLKRKLLEVDAAFALLDRPVPAALQAELRLSIVDQATGAISNLRSLQDEIAVLEGRATEAGLKVRDMLAAGVPPELVERYARLSQIRDRLAEQQRVEEQAARERDREAARELESMRQKADRLRDETATPEERVELKIAELEQLRSAIDPDSGTPLLDEETYRRALEKIHADQIDAAGREAAEIRGSGERLSQTDLRSAEGANLIADLINGRTSVDEQQLAALNQIHAGIGSLIEVTEDRDKIRKVNFNA